MSYCTSSDVEGRFKATTFSASTSPTLAQVDQWITEADAVINAALANRFEVPVTAGEGLEILKDICTDFVAHKVRDVITVKTQVPENNQEGARVNWEERGFKKLRKIVEGKLVLIVKIALAYYSVILAVQGGS